MKDSLHYFEDNNSIIIVDKSSCRELGLDDITCKWFEPTFWRFNNAVTGQASGRGSTLFLHWLGVDMILRHYCRGGAIRHISEDRFVYAGLEKTRAWRELSLLQYMHTHDLPVPQGIGARILKGSLFYRADLICRRIPNAKDAHEVLVHRPINEEVWYQMGVTIKKMHRANVYHHDLNIRNIMLDTNDKVWIIDFDKCSVKSGIHWQQGNIERLERSLLKEKGRSDTFHYNAANWQNLLMGYAES